METKSSASNGLSAKPASAEIRNRIFKRTALGYSPKEVDEFLETMASLWDDALNTERELNEKIQTVTDELNLWKGREAEIVKLRERTFAEAEGVRVQAEKDAARAMGEVEERAANIRAKTEEWLEDVIARVEDTERQRHSFMTAFRSALDSHYALLNTTKSEEAEPLSAQLTQFLRTSESRPQSN